ncbi:MAG: hypothetical protein Q7U98_14445 [Methylicorpusculum sp.]|uniref:hypothetical protein n=1 Tax=Methylicorpusculum sp. TaxID=2713644 RepID=UPI00272697C0|nr:hypothetical protein [Methylicorpusculum sp.]MDO8846159.1 hypothetical protein [Methylicorpusculum sp.]MDO8940349.1 hypothetical protein [Methylicorpusculum sp.]MDP2177937.1 hypothetical protein [Methylicorpusculum sp.]MDP2203806.1 hypothetical protein [Methylicorpusculum sp.]MDP3528209.1 hypothetical protein [Methylicorpusculum sp.]
MDLLKELEQISEKIKTQRDEIMVQMHLAGLDAKSEWDKAEEKWHELKIKAEEIKDETKETTDELVSKTKVIADELNTAYQRIVERLKAD